MNISLSHAKYSIVPVQTGGAGIEMVKGSLRYQLKGKYPEFDQRMYRQPPDCLG